MKKYFERVAILLAVVVVGFGSVYAQEAGDMDVGISIVYTPDWVKESRDVGDPKSANTGLSARFQYNVTTPMRLAGVFTYLPNGDNLGMWDLSVNAHYLLPVVKKLNVYPVAGLDLMRYTSEGAYINLGSALIVNKKVAGNYTMFGVNIGGGVECKLGKRVSLQGEVKYILGFDNTIFSDYYKTNRLIISIGAVYKF